MKVSVTLLPFGLMNNMNFTPRHVMICVMHCQKIMKQWEMFWRQLTFRSTALSANNATLDDQNYEINGSLFHQQCASVTMAMAQKIETQ